MERDNPWATLIAAAGATGAAIGVVYLVGGVVLSLRYEGLGLSGQQAVGLTAREVVLFAGARSLAIWGLLGLAIVIVLLGLPAPAVQGAAARLTRPPALAVIAAVLVGGLLLLHVWWPLATLVAVLGLVLAVARWRGRPVRLFLAAVAAIALIAVSVEADRLRYLVDRACVTAAPAAAPAAGTAAGPDAAAQPNRRTCGILVGQSDRGFYIGVIGAGAASIPSRLVFLPADRVAQAASIKREAHVVPSWAASRRERLISRLLGIEIR